MHVEANWAYMKAINVSTARTANLLLTSKTLLLMLFYFLKYLTSFTYYLHHVFIVMTISVLSTLLSYPSIPLVSNLYLPLYFLYCID